MEAVSSIDQQQRSTLEQDLAEFDEILGWYGVSTPLDLSPVEWVGRWQDIEEMIGHDEFGALAQTASEHLHTPTTPSESVNSTTIRPLSIELIDLEDEFAGMPVLVRQAPLEVTIESDEDDNGKDCEIVIEIPPQKRRKVSSRRKVKSRGKEWRNVLKCSRRQEQTYEENESENYSDSTQHSQSEVDDEESTVGKGSRRSARLLSRRTTSSNAEVPSSSRSSTCSMTHSRVQTSPVKETVRRTSRRRGRASQSSASTIVIEDEVLDHCIGNSFPELSSLSGEISEILARSVAQSIVIPNNAVSDFKSGRLASFDCDSDSSIDGDNISSEDEICNEDFEDEEEVYEEGSSLDSEEESPNADFEDEVNEDEDDIPTEVSDQSSDV